MFFELLAQMVEIIRVKVPDSVLKSRNLHKHVLDPDFCYTKLKKKDGMVGNLEQY